MVSLHKMPANKVQTCGEIQRSLLFWHVYARRADIDSIIAPINTYIEMV